MSDKRILHIYSVSVLLLLFLIIFSLSGVAGRILGALLMAAAAVTGYTVLKKRSVFSIHKRQVLLLVTVSALVFVMVYFLSGLYFGFDKNVYRLNLANLLKFSVPITLIIVSSEVVRSVMLASEDKWGRVSSYVICVVAEILMFTTVPAVTSFSNFMDFVALSVFPAITSNLLYHYLSKRYGMTPNIVYRLITTLYIYLIPVSVDMSESLMAIALLLLPFAVYLFIDGLYEKKVRLALRKKNILNVPVTVITVVIMVFVMMLISNRFRFGALVIATESMTGELNKGDVVLYERYDDQFLVKGQVIVYEKNDSMIVHRIADIDIINENKRYYTKGDANESNDEGFITNADIVGVANFKIPYFGYPTLWLRSLFER